MSDKDREALPDASRARLQRPFSIVRSVAQGLLIGVTTLAAAVLVGIAIVEMAWQEPAPCDGDRLCLPDLGPLILAILAMPVVIAAVGPLVAKLLRLSSPWIFAAPVAWAAVMACVGLGPADSKNHWPFNSPISTLSIFLVLYALLAVWVAHRREVGKADADQVKKYS